MISSPPKNNELAAAKPILEDHEGILVVRDDLYPGGTKARFIPQLFLRNDEVVYASPQEGGAQTSLAWVARALGKRATIFVASREEPHERVRVAKALGARILQVSPGYLGVVRNRARKYCEVTGSYLAPFGLDFPGAVEAIAHAARSIGETPDEVWCAGGSGTLARGLMAAWPGARLMAVEVGKGLTLPGATIVPAGEPFGRAHGAKPPFPSDPHYDAKAWGLCRRNHGKGKVLFWNVLGPALDMMPAEAQGSAG